MFEWISIFGIKTTLVESSDVAHLAATLAGGPNQAIFFCNVHMLMLAQEDEVLASALTDADVVFADGVPVARLQSRLSGKEARVIRGYEMMLAICRRAQQKGEKVGFLGSTPDVMASLVGRLTGQFEGLSVAFQYCPPFVRGELTSTAAELEALRDSGIRWLFVGLGCPKQEKWVARYKHELDCTVLAVGAAFDWLSGKAGKPPGWMERCALGWLYRLVVNPSKMWHRYLIYNTKFLVKASRVWFEGK